MKKYRIAVTGCSGYLGQALLRALEEDPQIDQVVGLDLQPCQETEKTRFVRADVRDPKLGQVLKTAGVNAIVHLAFVIEAAREPSTARDVNVNGTANVLRAAAEAGVSTFLMTSSMAVYGAWADNPELLTEDMPPRPNSDDAYGQQKVQAEWLCRDFAEAHPKMAVSVMRPCAISGPNFRTPFLEVMRKAPFLPLPKGGRGSAQFIHEDDAARLIVLMVKQNARGTFNGVGRGTMRWRSIYESLGKPIVELPQRLLSRVLGMLWRIRVMPILPVQTAMIAYPMVLSGDRARRLLGFRPKYTTSAAMQATFSCLGLA